MTVLGWGVVGWDARELIYPLSLSLCWVPRRTSETDMSASRETGELLAELEKPEPSWPPPQPTQATRGRRGGGGGGGGGGSAGPPSRPFAISRKWTTDLKACHAQVSFYSFYLLLLLVSRDYFFFCRGGGPDNKVAVRNS